MSEAIRELRLSAEDRKRFWAAVDKKEPSYLCWPWKLSVGVDGVGQFSAVIDGKKAVLRANRIAFWLWNTDHNGNTHQGNAEELAKKHNVTRSQLDVVSIIGCGVASCCNPNHFQFAYLGHRRRRSARLESERAPTRVPLTIALVKAALDAAGGNVTHAAARLACSRTHLQRLMGAWGLRPAAAGGRRRKRTVKSDK